MQSIEESRLSNLRMRLDHVSNAWTVHDHESLMKFYVDIIPKLLHAERCSIFIVESEDKVLWLKYGTGLKEKEIMPPVEGTVVGKVISSGTCVIDNNIDSNSEYQQDLLASTGFLAHNILCAPIKSLTGGAATGAIQVLNKKEDKQFTGDDGKILQEVAHYLSIALESFVINEEMIRISSQLNREINEKMEEDISIVAESDVMQNILETVKVVCTTPVNVLIHGESGTGKEVIARLIHSGSDRRNKSFVPVNCAAVPENLVESEFFGYEKGAFTGAVGSRKGRFEEADGGTLFLDEVGDMPMVMQPKFLRVLQEGEGSRLGSNHVMNYDLRVISATNKDLRKEVSEGRFREDMFYRIFSVEIYIPPLRERHNDVIPLALFFLKKVSRKFKKRVPGFSADVLNFFEHYPWPGNVRQLEHEVERLIAFTPERNKVALTHCSQELKSWMSSRAIIDFQKKEDLTMPEKVTALEIGCISDALKKTGGNKRQASGLLGITRQGLDKKLKRYEM
jgi:transcriptional regulator with GAF, ATPase, and Fis domain